jgi:SAM-dependent methyltransferase
LAEFTGERLIPGQVDIDLLNEHMARYTFAARLARGKRVLDVGCGAGYGSAELAQEARSVLGIDIAAEAVNYARANYRQPNLSFEQGSGAALPHADSIFDLVVAFEVIEHLENFSALLQEARRVLAPNGQFIVSTPNKLYYTESRGREGANPFHVHEFEFEEFREELKQVFPHVSLFLENHVEGVTFQPHDHGQTVEVRVDAGEPAAAESHFFVAVCARRPQVGNPTFVYIPRTGNVLRERERHIAALEGELEIKNGWLDKAQQDLAEFDRQHQEVLAMFRAQKAELERSNQWAESLDRSLNEARARIAELQQELEREQENARLMAEGYESKLRELEADLASKIGWARDAERRLEEQIADKKRAIEILHATEKELEDRTAWAFRLEEERGRLEEERGRLEGQVTLYRTSRWVRLGRKVGLGPEIPS